MSPSLVDVGRLLDNGRWGGYQRVLIGLTALAIIFDGIDNQLMGVAIPTIMREWSVARADFAPVVSLGYVGMMIGGAVAGLAGDRLGRRVALLASMVLFGVMTMAMTLVDNIAALAALRCVTGIGLGGAIPNAAALSAEYVPVRQRPFAVTLTILCIPVGATLAGLIAIPVLPAFGWRALFLFGGLAPVITAVVLRWLLPESPRFLTRHPHRRDELARSLARMGHNVPEDAVLVNGGPTAVVRPSIGGLFIPEFRRDTSALWAAYFSCMLAVYLGFSWVPSMLTGAGFTSSVASTGITVFNLGGVVGALAAGACITWWGTRRAMLTMSALAAVSAGVMAFVHLSPTAAVLPILALLATTGGLINAVQTTMYALGAHVYPAEIRATGVGSAASFGRLGAVVSGYAGALALEHGGSTMFFIVMAAAMAVCWIALAGIQRHVPGRH
jgi:AAHS family 4-hydroxybenzoate transporter-like MFS transporter